MDAKEQALLKEHVEVVERYKKELKEREQKLIKEKIQTLKSIQDWKH